MNLMAQRERHPVTAESDMPVLFPACSNPGLHNPGPDHSREGQAPSNSSRRRDPIPYLPGPRQAMREAQTPDRSGPRCQGDDPQPVLRRPPRGAFLLGMGSTRFSGAATAQAHGSALKLGAPAVLPAAEQTSQLILHGNEL